MTTTSDTQTTSTPAVTHRAWCDPQTCDPEPEYTVHRGKRFDTVLPGGRAEAYVTDVEGHGGEEDEPIGVWLDASMQDIATADQARAIGTALIRLADVAELEGGQEKNAPRVRTGIDADWPDGRWGDDEVMGPSWYVELTPGALPATVRRTDYDRIAVQPSVRESRAAHVSLLVACESVEHNTELTLDEAEAYGHAILAAVAAARTRVTTTP
jgi:hypothetical protein